MLLVHLRLQLLDLRLQGGYLLGGGVSRRLTARTASPPAPLPRAQEPDADENKLLPIIAIGGGGTLLSTVFFAENLKRLGTKVASGGKDDGYTKSSNQRRR